MSVSLSTTLSSLNHSLYTQLALLIGLNDKKNCKFGSSDLTLNFNWLKSSYVSSVHSSHQQSVIPATDFIFSGSSSPLNKISLPFGNVSV